MNPQLKHFLENEGYSNLREVPGRGLCGTYRFLFTTGLVYGIDESGYKGRYCYETAQEAVEALSEWDGENDPGGEWIKHKGKTEYSNPNL